MSSQNFRIGAKLITLTIPVIAVPSAVAALAASNRADADPQEKLSHRAKSLAHQIMAYRKYYASVLVPRIKELGGSLGADYAEVLAVFRYLPLLCGKWRGIRQRSGPALRYTPGNAR